jgi:Ca2+-binding RTX toxin-like protein
MHLETLERRLFLSSVTFENQTLTIIGSPGRDRIRINITIVPTGSHATVLINGRGGVVQDFPRWASPLPKVMVQAGLGNDTINYNTHFAALPTTLLGGAGADDIKVVNNSTIVFAGRGNDIIEVVSDDTEKASVFGGDGDDHIVGSMGDFEFHGGNGNDTLIGDRGADKLFGDAGNDALKGGEGIDIFFGGDGNDRFYAEDSHANEPGDAGEGMDRAFFFDCSLPFDEFPNIESLRTLGNRHWFGCGCC